MNAAPLLSLVIPCFNEEQVLPETSSRLVGLMKRLIEGSRISPNSRIWFVDDGSRDATWAIIQSGSRAEPLIQGIKLARNVGHQNALLAGLMSVPGDAVISLDSDLQDDLGAIEKMLDQFAEGCEIVYGVRSSRETDTFMKRFTARSYYWLLQKMGADCVYDHADYRLMSRPALEALREYKEVNLFLRGLVPLIGFETGVVQYVRAERFAGETKYPLRKMLALAVNGITSFSVTPLRWITFFGLFIAVASLALGFWALAARFFSSAVVPGWTSTVLPIYFLGGIQLLALGVIGEYQAKAYMETKSRPRFLVAKTTMPIRQNTQFDRHATESIDYGQA